MTRWFSIRNLTTCSSLVGAFRILRTHPSLYVCELILVYRFFGLTMYRSVVVAGQFDEVLAKPLFIVFTDCCSTAASL